VVRVDRATVLRASGWFPACLEGGPMRKKLTLSKETLRTLDEKELSLVVGGASGGNSPKCPNTKEASCDCNTNGAVCHP
jgi:hypothetical protein